MLMSAQVYNTSGYFQIKAEDGTFVPAKHIGNGMLEPATENDLATTEDVFAVFERRIKSYLIKENGEFTTFKEEGIDESSYTREHEGTGYANLPLKLIYAVFPNEDKEFKDLNKAESFVFPVSGFGLWAAIYGYLAVANDGYHVVGISWYKHGETPGLGANIAAPWWQEQFEGKVIFQKDKAGNVDVANAPVGITVMRGKVSETLGDSPKAHSAVDGMSGATLTGNGVTKAYKETLAPYRPFLLRVNEHFKETNAS